MQQIRRVAAAFGVAAVAGVLAWASPAAAQDGPVLPAVPWEALDSGADPAADTHVADPWTVRLVVDGDNPQVDLGTSVETADLGLSVGDGAQVAFRHTTVDGAGCGGNNVRVFVEVDGTYVNSWDQLQSAGLQCGTDSVVTFTLPDGGTVGHVGVVMDNAPPEPGVVEVTDLTVDGVDVLFAEVCEWDPSIGADADGCEEPGLDPSPSVTAAPDSSPSHDTSPAAEEGELPATGTTAGGIAIAGAGVLAAGIAFVVISRRKRAGEAS